MIEGHAQAAAIDPETAQSGPLRRFAKIRGKVVEVRTGSAAKEDKETGALTLDDLERQADLLLPPMPPADLVPPPDHPAHFPAGDPGREWRKKRAWLDAEGFDADDSPRTLDRLPIDERQDIWFRMMEWSLMALCPQVRAMAKRGVAAGEAMLRCETDASGRAVSLGRLMGLQPEGGGGLSAGQAVARKRRNALLRQARASRPEWRDVPDRRAAAMMLAAFQRYRGGGWQADRTRPTAPAGDAARAAFWRVLRLEVPVPETVEGMKLILEG